MIFIDLKWGTNVATVVLTTFNAIAVWSAIPLTLRMFATLKDHRSLYFRAMLVSSWGLSLRATAYFCTYFASAHIPWYVTGMSSQIGWICMVSGFAMVLWSRLGFILSSHRAKRYLLWMIIFNGVVFHTTMTVLGMSIWGMNTDLVKHKVIAARFGAVQRVFECIQIVAFNGQEVLLSSLYIHAAYVYLRDWGSLGVAGSRMRIKKSMILLLVLQAVVVTIDVAIITIDLLGLLQLKGMIHSFIYCVKLELEFLVLNQLVEISKLGVPGLPSTTVDSAEPVIERAQSSEEEGSEGFTETVRVLKWDMNMHLRTEWQNPCEIPSMHSPRTLINAAPSPSDNAIRSTPP